MGYGLTFLKFRNGGFDKIPREEIIEILKRQGCKVPELIEGINHVGLPRDDEAGDGFSAESALLVVDADGEVTEFGLGRPQGTSQCRALVFALVNSLGLVMFPGYGGAIFARQDVFADIPQEIVKQFPERIIVTRPEDCI